MPVCRRHPGPCVHDEHHKIGDRGTAIGPDLTTIGKLRPRADLLESILEPSRRIEPNFAAYVCLTADGKSITGLIVKRDEKGVTLRDAENKEIVVAVDDVVRRRTGPSAMPDDLHKKLSRRELRDVVEFLSSLKESPKK